MRNSPIMGLLAACTLLVTGIVTLAAAQQYPAKPVKFIVGFAPGGATDIVARAVAQKLSESLGQPVVIENRGGAGGNIATDVVAKAAPDGHTLLVATTNTQTINPTLYAKLPFDAEKDLVPVTLMAENALVLVVNPAVPARSLSELIAVAKSKPGQLNASSAGTGSLGHLAGELFKTMVRVDIVHVPYNGAAPAVTALLGGEVNLSFTAMPVALPHIAVGRLRALAVTSASRSRALPEVPTMSEAAVPGFEATSWFGVLAPAGTPKAIVSRLHGEIVKTLRTPDLRERLSKQGLDPVGSTPEEFSARIREDTARFAKVIKASGMKVE